MVPLGLRVVISCPVFFATHGRQGLLVRADSHAQPLSHPKFLAHSTDSGANLSQGCVPRARVSLRVRLRSQTDLVPVTQGMKANESNLARGWVTYSG